MMMDVIKTLKEKHPYLDETAMELFEHYAKEYDRELDLIIEVEISKFISYVFNTTETLEEAKMMIWTQFWIDKLKEYLEAEGKVGGKSDKEEI